MGSMRVPRGDFIDLELDEEVSLSGGDEVWIQFAWDESFFPDERVEAGLARGDAVEILASNAVVPGPFSRRFRASVA